MSSTSNQTQITDAGSESGGSIIKPNGNGAWKKGQSGNPAGRKPGTRNHATLLSLALMEVDGLEVVKTVINAAKAGDMQAARIIVDRLAPVAKERPIKITLPVLKDLASCAGAHAQVAAAVAEGELLPGEGQALASLIEGQRKHYESALLEERIAALELALQEKTIQGARL